MSSITTFDGIVNKAPLSYRTNRKIGGHAPSIYLEKIQHGLNSTPKRLNEIVTSHSIDPALLRSDDFEGFFNARRDAIVQRIENAMGKPIARDFVEE